MCKNLSFEHCTCCLYAKFGRKPTKIIALKCKSNIHQESHVEQVVGGSDVRLGFIDKDTKSEERNNLLLVSGSIHQLKTGKET